MTKYVVIGAALPRTGTTSLRAALEQLIGPTYHMDAMLLSKGKDHAQFWNRALMRRVTEDEFKRFVEALGLRAAVDYPMAFFWREQLRMFPDAKVILTVRSPESWYRSVRETVLNTNRTYRTFPGSLAYSLFARLVGRDQHCKVCDDVCWAIPEGFSISMFGAVSESQERAVEFFNQWVGEVKATVPKERLLVFEADSGWEPLCNFLHVPIPSNPYPTLNDAKKRAVQETILKKIVFATAMMPCMLAAIAVFFFFFF